MANQSNSVAASLPASLRRARRRGRPIHDISGINPGAAAPAVLVVFGQALVGSAIMRSGMPEFLGLRLDVVGRPPIQPQLMRVPFRLCGGIAVLRAGVIPT
jgi:hypothetical protein